MIELRAFKPLDSPIITAFLFHPRQGWTAPPAGATDHVVPISAEVRLVCRSYAARPSSETVLYFHGNGEIACDYDDIARLFQELDLNLFVADYRGYGSSTGAPSFTAILQDAEAVYRYVLDWRAARGLSPALFLMGRSLGSAPALWLACAHPEAIRGLIIESGFGSPVRLLAHLGMPLGEDEAARVEEASQRLVKGVTTPALIIHGANDLLVPLSEAQYLHDDLGSREKTLIVIPRAQHNNLLQVGEQRYFWAIDQFTRGKMG
ncbi:MAG: alpha/beta fold hydrolase [Chloroflexi bacterium]|nr:alpha/beta fold hydrolase [Chloroflexota bacterium]